MSRPAVFLTGATGMLGSILCRDLLRAGYRVAVLVRPGREKSAAARMAEIVASWRRRHLDTPQNPIILSGELRPPGVCLDAADQRWLRQHRPLVLHAAADLSFRTTADGEPRRTNVEGTAALVHLCQQLSLRHFHYISTAFVCGRYSRVVREEELAAAPVFHNPYEASKWEAEGLLRAVDDLETTVYRPAVIVGESDSGYATNFTGLYRIAELAVRLAEPEGAAGQRRLPLRVPLTGDETCHVVPVDWVSRAVVELLGRVDCHGRTFHLTGTGTTTSRLLYDAAAAVFRLKGVQFVGPEGVGEPSRLEEAFWEGVQEYWPYLGGTPPFDDSNTRLALPDLPAPVVDQPMLERMFRFAEAAGWGRRSRRPPPPVACADYVEQTFPRLARHSPLARAAGLDVVVGLDVRGHGGGQWSCEWVGGDFRNVQRGLSERAGVTYQLDVPTFVALLEECLTPQQAFYEGRLDVSGDVETGLKLAVLFTHFLRDEKEVVRECSGNPAPVRR